MVIFEVKRWLWQFRILFLRYLIFMVLLVWSLVFYMYDSYYVVPLIILVMFSTLTFYYDKSDQESYIKELRFYDEEKILEVIYYRKGLKKMSKTIPYEFLWYHPQLHPRNIIWAEFTSCLLWHNEHTSHLYDYYKKSQFKVFFNQGIETYTSTQFKAILKKLSEVGHLVDTTDDFFKGYTYSFFK